MSDAPPEQPFIVCYCGYKAEFFSTLRRHQYGIRGGITGRHTQLPRRRPRQASTGDDGRNAGGGDGEGGVHGAALRSGAGVVATGAGCVAADGILGGDESEAPPSPSPSWSKAPATPPAASESGATAHSAVESQLRTLLELTRVLVPPTDGGGAAAEAVPEYLYSSVGLHVRALCEALGDARRAEPFVLVRNRAKTGRFNTVRLRALEWFALKVAGAGLS